MLRADQLGTVESASVEAPSYTKEEASATGPNSTRPFFSLLLPGARVRTPP